MKGRPLEFLLLLFAGWANRRQLAVIDYLKEENKILREQLQCRRLHFTDDQRRRLAVRDNRLLTAPASQRRAHSPAHQRRSRSSQ